MRTITETDTKALDEVLRAEGPVASIYFRREPRPRRENAELRWHALAEGLAARGAGPGTLRVLTERVHAALPGSGMLAAFAAGDRLLYATELAQPPDLPDQPETAFEDAAAYGAAPHLLPLLEWWQEHPAHVLAVVDRTGADIDVFPQGSAEAVHQKVTGPDDEIERNAPGGRSGRSQMRYQHRAEDSWEHNATRVAETLSDDLARYSADLLLLAGDVRALQYLSRHLPPWVRKGVAIREVPGPGTRGEPVPARFAGRETHRAVNDDNRAVLRRLAEQRYRAGLAVEGPHATLGALSRGQVNTLVVTHDPADRRTAWFGPAPTDVSDRRRELPQTPATRAPLTDVAVRAAVLTGADVRVLPPGTPDAPARGIGALCRFAA
jgi:release factor family 2